ncbi:MAG: CoB--CoM heterodisulfide reductase iron-sulfur subunit B family protein [Candidatus Thorarchaeota archaeon]|nr:CoB--CoM heterodisulfide reductase iron-sulfur subunit B family protein [Candidatus Thorarchaeota archaeon]
MSKTRTYTYFPGCMIPYRLPHFELTMREVLKKLDVELETTPDHSCCPEPTTFTGVDFEAWVTIAARNVAVSEATGNDTVALCSGCFHTLAVANHMVHEDEELKKRINTRLKKSDLEITGTHSVKNILHLLRNDIGLDVVKKQVTNPLKKLKIAPHYGCHLVRPLEATNMDHADNPQWMDEVIKATGAEIAEFEGKMSCCGAPIMPSGEKKAVTITSKHLKNIKASGADAIVVVCPTCYTQMETQQAKAEAIAETEFNIPVLYLGELMALSMGLTDLVTENQRRFHRVKLTELLEKAGGAS